MERSAVYACYHTPFPSFFPEVSLPKERIDLLLVQRGLCESREKAQRCILAGEVMVGTTVITKPGTRLPADAEIVLKSAEKYVGRGGLKLEAALAHFAVSVEGATCLDVGASTGGFTDCLLQHGAAKVHAIDVGHSQLAWKIRSDPRVAVREHMNARHMTRENFPDEITLAVVDVSFISLTLILPPLVNVVTAGGVIVALIKPQFELRREEVGKGGIVREPALHARAVEKIRTFVHDTLGREWLGVIDSPIQGGSGNQEFLACVRNASA
jgi:23S rRNA (cytidine1920-2'-O)/16S rRNA (cytidine1409-2'-O)-methyltransferase